MDGWVSGESWLVLSVPTEANMKFQVFFRMELAQCRPYFLVFGEGGDGIVVVLDHTAANTWEDFGCLPCALVGIYPWRIQSKRQ